MMTGKSVIEQVTLAVQTVIEDKQPQIFKIHIDGQTKGVHFLDNMKPLSFWQLERIVNQIHFYQLTTD